jgi:hypothetical protein
MAIPFVPGVVARSADDLAAAGRAVGGYDDARGALRAVQDVRAGGQWVRRSESMSEAARAYQRYISGRADDLVYQVGGYTFDHFDEAAGVLVDAKAIPGSLIDTRVGGFRPWVSGTDTWLRQASNQVGAAGGVPIVWYFDSQAARDAMYGLFLEQNPTLLDSIQLIHRPMP